MPKQIPVVSSSYKCPACNVKISLDIVVEDEGSPGRTVVYIEDLKDAFVAKEIACIVLGVIFVLGSIFTVKHENLFLLYALSYGVAACFITRNLDKLLIGWVQSKRFKLCAKKNEGDNERS